MIIMETGINVEGISGRDVYHFMINCTDDDYRKWWNGTHLAFHTTRRFPKDLGNQVYFDGLVGKRRLKFEGVVAEIIPGKKIIWQMKKVVKVPAWLAITLDDREGCVNITHSMSIGFRAMGRILDPLLRIYFSNEFERDLREHAHTEFRLLAKMLA
jgi:hypothetical protein